MPGLEPNGKLDFFHWIRVRWVGGADPYIDKPSTGTRQIRRRALDLSARTTAKRTLMLCGVWIRRLLGQSNLSSFPEQNCGERGWRERVELLAAPPPPPPPFPPIQDLNQNVNGTASEGSRGPWDRPVLILRSEYESLCLTTKCVFPWHWVTRIAQSSAGFSLGC